MKASLKKLSSVGLAFTLFATWADRAAASDPAIYNLSQDFNRTNNPAGAWSLGWKSTVLGGLHIYTVPKAVPSDERLPIDTWSSGPETAQVQHNGTTNTATTSGGAGNFPPGTVILTPGHEYNPDIYTVARLTVPPARSGTYRVEIAVRTYLDGSISGDADFHIVKDNTEIFGQFLPPNGSTSYTNIIPLAAGQQLDFICGNGADGRNYNSGLKLASRIVLVDTNPSLPVILVPPQDTSVSAGSSASFRVVAASSTPLNYQWLKGGAPIGNATNASFTIKSVQGADEGTYSVRVSNAQGNVVSSGAVLTVSAPYYDLSRDFSPTANPNGPWSLGWKSTVEGTLHVYTVPKAVPSDEGLPMDTWSSGPETAQVQHNGNTQTITTDGGAGSFPPGTVILTAGHEFNPDIYTVARLTVPISGTYRVEIGVRSYLDGPISGDTDFHILKDNAEIFGQFLPGNGSATYSNAIPLAAGEYLDFVCGNGADGRNFASGLKFASKITQLSTNASPPIILVQPASLIVSAGDTAKFRVIAAATATLNYEWRKNDAPLGAPNSATLILSNVQQADVGTYSVRVSNSDGEVLSSGANLEVNAAPIAKINVAPLFNGGTEQSNLVVISANGVDAAVVLDGSQSSDAENEPLQFAWFTTGAQVPFATGVRTTNTFGVGMHTVALVVSDAHGSGSATVTFDVITLSEAAAAILEQIDAADLGRRSKQPLMATLKSAMASLEAGHTTAGLNELHALQQKIAAQVGPFNPTLADALIRAIQQILDAARS